MTLILFYLMLGAPHFRSLPTAAGALPAGEGCVLVANKGEVWLRVYQETGNSQKGTLIWDGHLVKDETHPVDSQPNDRIRYDYKNDPNDEYHGNVGATCQDGAIVSVP
jgi:hypothetical protein